MNDLMLLARHQGYVTAADAATVGTTHTQLHRLVNEGRLERGPHRVYLLPGERTPEARHTLVTRAILSTDPFTVASHHSALALHGAPLFGVPLNQVHVADPRAASRAYDSLHRHVLRGGDALASVGDLKAIAPTLACLTVAARFGVRPGLVATNHCLRHGLTTLDDLTEVLESGRLRRGLVGARRVVSLANPLIESPGESLLHLGLVELPLTVELQVPIPGTPYRSDFLVDGRVVVEFDGEMKYDGPDGHAALMAEKTRQDRINNLGYEVVRVTWKELANPDSIRRRVLRAATRARARRFA